MVSQSTRSIWVCVTLISPRFPLSNGTRAPPVILERGERTLARGPASAFYLPAHEPQHDKHDQDDAEDAAETGAAVATVCIISPASAEDEDQDYDKENCTHISGLRAGESRLKRRVYGFFAASRTASLRLPTAF